MMKWMVYKENFNTKEVVPYNIFDHTIFYEEVEKLKNLRKPLTKEELSTKLKRLLRCYYWSKCEYETVITSWPPYISPQEIQKLNKEAQQYEEKFGSPLCKVPVSLSVGIKVDIYDQVDLNWDAFVDYVYKEIN